MIRYTKQRNEYACGATAILNVLKWMGFDVSWDNDIDDCMYMCECEKGKGSWSWNMDFGLADIPEINVKKTLYLPKLKQIDKQLDKGRALIVGYLHDDGVCQFGHYMLCVGKTNKYYKVVNDTKEGKALSKITRKTMSKKLRTKKVEAGALFYCVAWAIEEGDE